MAFTGINLKKPKADFDEGPCSLKPKIWGGLVLKLELALFYIDIEQRSQLHFPTDHLKI